MADYSLPAKRLLEKQAGWLAPARSRLLRRVTVAQRRYVLELGSAYGTVTSELIRRTRGSVVALDKSYPAQQQMKQNTAAWPTVGDAEQLPFRAATFDLLVAQHLFMWLSNPTAAMAECVRVLQPSGAAILIEPDYGGLIEYPEAVSLQALWVSALRRAGADPLIGRKLPTLAAAAGLRVRTFLLEEIRAPEPDRFEILEQLPLLAGEAAEFQRVKAAAEGLTTWQQLTHLPYMLVIAEKAT